jgi:hypothetical protein
MKRNLSTTSGAIALAVSLAAGLAAVVPASAEFDEPVIVSPRSQDALYPKAAMSNHGTALIAWTRDGLEVNQLLARTRSATGVLRPVISISELHGWNVNPELQVATDGGGNTLIVWNDGRNENQKQVHARAHSAAGALGPIDVLSRPNVFDPQVAMNAAGDAVIVWLRYVRSRHDGVVQARTRSAAGVLGPVLTLPEIEKTSSNARVAIDSRGNALVVWRLGSSSDNGGWLQARSISAAGVLGPIVNVSRIGVANEPQVAMDADGAALVVWRGRGPGTDYRIQTRVRTAAGLWRPAQTIAESEQVIELPKLAMNANGDALMVWRRVWNGMVTLQARARSAAGVLGSIETISAESRFDPLPRVAIDASGDAVIVWQRHRPSREVIQARRHSAAGVFGPIETLSNPEQDAGAPDVVMNADGRALAVWHRRGDTNWRIQAAADDD